MSELALVLTILAGVLGWLAGSSWRHLTRTRADYRTALESKRKLQKTRTSAWWSTLLWIGALVLLVYLTVRSSAGGLW